MPDKKTVDQQEKIASHKLETEPPLSEKDEVRKAEARTAKAAENVKADLKNHEK